MPKLTINEVMDEFFEMWTLKTIAWYEEMKNLYKADRKAHDEAYPKYNHEYRLASQKLEHKWYKDIGTGNLEMIKNNPMYDTPGRGPSIEKLVRRDMEVRKANFYAKVSQKVGEVTDVNLHVGPDGSPNGVVVGTNGKVNVTTIYAGGHSVQRLHYRVLIK